jgi:hypothetical protein
MFVRFETIVRCPKTRLCLGIFRAADAFDNRNRLSAEERAFIESEYAWF